MQLSLNELSALLPVETPPVIKATIRSLNVTDRSLDLVHKILSAATSIDDVRLASSLLRASAPRLKDTKEGIEQIRKTEVAKEKARQAKGMAPRKSFILSFLPHLSNRLTTQEALFSELSLRTVSAPTEFFESFIGPGGWSFRPSTVKLPTLQTHFAHFRRNLPIIESAAKSIIQARRKVDAARWMLRTRPEPAVAETASRLLTEADQHLRESADDMGLLVSRGFMPPGVAITVWRQTKKLLGLAQLRTQAVSAGLRGFELF